MSRGFSITNPPLLKPCPFCGGPAYLIGLFIPVQDDEINAYQVGCENCEIERQQDWEYERIVNWWNQRKTLEPRGPERRKMKARFLQSILVEDGRHRMLIECGEELTATDRGDFYELRKRDGRGTMAPKDAEGTIYEIVEDGE